MALGWRGQYYKYREYSLNLLAIYKRRPDLQAFLEIMLSLGTLIVFIIFAIKPTALTMISLDKEIKAKETTLDGLNQKINDLQTANAIYIANEASIQDIDMAIFDSPQPDVLSKQIIGLANRNSVTILGFSVGQVAIFGKNTQSTAKAPDTLDLKPLPNQANALPITINVKGKYANLVSLLSDLEKLRIPIKIDALTLNSTQTDSGTALVELVNGRVPYLTINQIQDTNLTP